MTEQLHENAQHENAQLAFDTIQLKPTRGIPSFIFHVLKHSYIERLAGVGEGDYQRDPVNVYRKLQENVGTCIMDQWIPTNPLSMTDQGYGDDAHHGATTGAEQIVCDGLVIDSPEAAAEHLERFVFLSAMGIYPDMPWENVRTYVEGIQYYRRHGREG